MQQTANITKEHILPFQALYAYPALKTNLFEILLKSYRILMTRDS